MKTIIHVLGARPNFIKAAPLIKKMNESLDVNNIILHTGQHYDKNMSGQFFVDLNIPKPDVNLGLGGGSQASQTANIMIGCEKVFKEYRPKVVVVYGDVNSCVAATLVASKLHLEEGYDKIKVVHVESGLRSYDRTMPEELNRVVTDGLADYLFVSCEDAIQNLVEEGIDSEKCFFVGNTMIDSLIEFEEKFDESTILSELDLDKKEYALTTIHRPFTVDNISRLKDMMDSLINISKGIECVLPIHPRTKNALVKNDLNHYFESKLKIIEPLGYLDFMCLQKNAKFIITDSGGVQEESSYFNVPCLTIRDNTERPITCTDGTNKMIGTSYSNILDEVMMIDFSKKSKIKLWDGKASDRIVQVFKDVIL